MACVLRCKYAHVMRTKCRAHCQRQTHILLKDSRRKSQELRNKLNGKNPSLPKPLQRPDQWQQYMAGLCAPTATAIPQLLALAPAGACQAAEPLSQPISSAEIKLALPLLNNRRSGARQGRPAKLMHYADWEMPGEDGNVDSFLVLICPLAAILDAAIQHDILPER